MTQTILRADTAQILIRANSDILGLIGAAYGLDGVLLLETDLSSEFFDLRSGLAGELFQKLSNYRLRAALVVPDPARHGPRFAELASEHRAHNLIRFFTDEGAALAWLEKETGES